MQVFQNVTQLHGIVERFKRRQWRMLVHIRAQRGPWNIVHYQVPVAIFYEVIIDNW